LKKRKKISGHKLKRFKRFVCYIERLKSKKSSEGFFDSGIILDEKIENCKTARIDRE
jgi:hypothetical protein